MRHIGLSSVAAVVSLGAALLGAGCGSVNASSDDSAACDALLTCCTSIVDPTSQASCVSTVSAGVASTCTSLFVAYETNGQCGRSTASTTTGSGTGTSTPIIISTGSTVTGTTGVVTSTKQTGTQSSSEELPDAGFDATFPEDANEPETGVDAGSSGPVVPAGARSILSGLVDVAGITSDDYLVYFDAQNGVSATDINGNITQIAPGPVTDGGIGPVIEAISGDLVAILTNYTTNASAEPEVGTLSIWSHSLGTLHQISTSSTGVLAVAADSSYVVYTDASNAAGTVGNINVVSGTATGATEILKEAYISIAAAACQPFAIVDNGYVVTSSCAATEAGTSTPSLRSFHAAGTAWTPVLLATNGGPSTPYTTGVINIATDTSGLDVLTVSGTPAALSVHGIASTTGLPLAASYGAPTNGVEFFYLSHASTFALFTQPSAALGLATFATPSSTPSITSIGSGVLGVQVISPDEKWDVDYTTPVDATSGAPTSLNLRNLQTGATTALVPAGSTLASTFGGTNGFTADSAYAIYTTDLTVTGSEATTGTLYTGAVATGSLHAIVANTTVWDAMPLTGDTILYNQNYVPNTTVTGLPNGAATADMYTVSASGTGPGTLLVAGADAPNGFYVTHDKSHLFFTFTQLQAVSGGETLAPGDGLYSIALP